MFFITFSGNPVAVETNHPTPFTETDKENIPGPSKELQAVTQQAPLSEVGPGANGDNMPHPVVRLTPVVPLKLNKTACRLCGDTEEITFCVGCGHKKPKSHRQVCSYWVHRHSL